MGTWKGPPPLAGCGQSRKQRKEFILRKCLPISGAIVLLCLLLASTTTALRPNTITPFHPDPCHGKTFEARAFELFAKKTWQPIRWEREKPKPGTVEAFRHKLRCAVGAGHREAMKETWHRERRRFGRYREFREIAPYPGGGTYWSIPFYIVNCESGGDWSAYNPSGALGPYQLLGWGAPYPATTWREKMENHRIARELWVSQGSSPWVCA